MASIGMIVGHSEINEQNRWVVWFVLRLSAGRMSGVETSNGGACKPAARSRGIAGEGANGILGELAPWGGEGGEETRTTDPYREASIGVRPRVQPSNPQSLLCGSRADLGRVSALETGGFK